MVRLALDAGHVVTTERLIGDLWEDDPPVNPTAALQSLVSRLRRQVGDAIVSSPAGYLLAADVDAHEFEALAAQGGRALRSGDPAHAAELLKRALALWRGEALADAAGLSFAIAPAAGLEEARLRAIGDRIAADLALGSPPDALVTELSDLVAAHPLREPFHTLLIRALLAAGRRADALAAYEKVRRLLADELGTDPGPDLRAAHLAALGDDAPPRRGNLPASRTTFVGRDDDVRRLTALFARERLITLTGPGGVGKTRLAIEVATALTTRPARDVPGPVDNTPEEARRTEPGPVWPGATAGEARRMEPGPVSIEGTAGEARRMGPGPVSSEGTAGEAGRVEPRPVPAGGVVEEAWLVELAPVAADGVAAVVRNTVGPIDELAGRRLLIVLDNCEHVIEAAAELAERILAAAPGVRILATSREPLDLPGEALHPVRPLGARQAMTLFADRAAAGSPGFRLDETTSPEVAAICARLDGVPLAIELTAARLRSLPLRDLAALLETSLLDRSARTAQRRHRTLRAVIDWSWELLGDEERTLLARMSVFAGGATAAAVERVCGADTETLLSLVDKSLVQAADGRYRLLETVRRFAAEKLTDPGPVRNAHLAWCVDLAERLDPQLRTAAQPDALAVADAENGNLDAALTYAIHLAQSTGRLPVPPGTPDRWPAWWAGPPTGQRRPPLPGDGEPAGPGDGEPVGSGGGEPVRPGDGEPVGPGGGEPVGSGGGVGGPLGRTGGDRVRAAGEQAGERPDGPAACPGGARVAAGRRRDDSVARAANPARPDADPVGGGEEDKDGERAHVAALRLFAARLWSWVMRGRHAEAAGWASALAGGVPPEGMEFEHALCVVVAHAPGLERAMAVLAGSDRPVALVAWSLVGGYVAEVDVAEPMRAVGRFADHPDPWARATALLTRALFLFEFTPGGAVAAEELLNEALARYAEIGEHWGLAMTRYWLSLALENRGDAAGALAVLEQAAADATRIGAIQALPAQGMLAVSLAQLRGRTGDLAGARTALIAARDAAERSGDRIALARAERGLGELARRAGDHAEALRHLTLAADLVAGRPASQQFRALLEVELSRVLAPEDGRAPLRRALDREFDDDVARATVLEGAAEWCLRVGDPRRAATLLGTARRLRGLEHTADPAVNALAEQCAAALGPAEFAAAWTAPLTPPGGAFLDWPGH